MEWMLAQSMYGKSHDAEACFQQDPSFGSSGISRTECGMA
jgi:hypothetical protein